MGILTCTVETTWPSYCQVLSKMNKAYVSF